MKCNECHGRIDEITGFCVLCGLEAPDWKERRFNKTVLHGSGFSGEEESRQRKSRKTELKQGPGNRGFVCNRCREMFQSETRDDSVMEFESKIKGFEQPGSNLYTFRIKQDLSLHKHLFHSGKPFADKYIRMLSADSNQKGSGEQK
jgi:hypothetical protein